MGRFQGLQVNETEPWGEDYEKESVQAVYQHGGTWTRWNELFRWLDESSEAHDAAMFKSGRGAGGSQV